MKFKNLAIDSRFRFKGDKGVGVKKHDWVYRMKGLNRIIQNENVEVVQTNKPTN